MRILVALSTVLVVAVSYFLLREEDRTRYGRMGLFVQECRRLITREDFVAICPSGAVKTGFHIVAIADRPRDSYRCGVIASASHTIGITTVVDVFADEGTARQRVEVEVNSGTQKQGNVLGFNETSIINYQRGVVPLIFAARGRAFIDIADPSQALCTPEQRIEIGRLLYQRVPNLEESVAQ